MDEGDRVKGGGGDPEEYVRGAKARWGDLPPLSATENGLADCGEPSSPRDCRGSRGELPAPSLLGELPIFTIGGEGCVCGVKIRGTPSSRIHALTVAQLVSGRGHIAACTPFLPLVLNTLTTICRRFCLHFSWLQPPWPSVRATLPCWSSHLPNSFPPLALPCHFTLP